MERTKPAAEFGAWLSIGAYIFLSVMKLAVGYASGSQALLADGLNNSSDIVASLAVVIGLRIARKPADAEHRYGHSRAETVASLVASFIMAVVGIEVLFQSVTRFLKGEVPVPNAAAAWTALFAAAVMYAVYRYNLRLSRVTGSLALKAAAADNRSDMLVSLGTFIGILGTVWGLYWLDSLAAVIVGLVICKTAVDIFKEATHLLTDGFDDKELETYKATVTSMEGVEHVKDIKGRIHGSHVFVDLTIEVDQRMSVYDSHAITENIEHKLREKHRIRHVHVHIEPH
ncbi:cation diffusion facilitator family transporter [Paenibacillus chartarius]|uniref:Cation diffusion facilitator family transporter n=1 Tax=Paenibacillus chartarius TaxID=747481 RepID=A0ABV6DP55_9BACL